MLHLARALQFPKGFVYMLSFDHHTHLGRRQVLMYVTMAALKDGGVGAWPPSQPQQACNISKMVYVHLWAISQHPNLLPLDPKCLL